MADTEHNVLTDPELHEPKGIAAASANQVYVADGAASGSFAQVSPSNKVMVHSASDFPSAIAGIRTLTSNTAYHVVGDISIGSDRLVMSASTSLVGNNPLVDKLTTTNAGAMITSADDCLITGLGFTCSSGDLISFTGGGTKQLIIDNCRVISCDTLGTVTTAALCRMTKNTVVACITDGITFAGTGGHLHIEGGAYDSTLGSVFDLGTSVWTTIHILAVQINNPAGVTGITVAASGANLSSAGIGFILDNYIETVATATSGYSVGDLKWIVKGNPGVQNNTGQAQGSIESSALTTTFAGTGAGNDVAVNFGAAFVSDVAKKFTVSTAGVITYTGVIPISVYVDCTMFGSIAGGAARQYNYYVAKGGTIIESSVSKREYDGTNVGANSCTSVVDLVTSDTITLRVRAETATTALTVNTCSITVTEVQ